MKNTVKIIFIISLAIGNIAYIFAQDEYITVSGTVRNKQNRKKLEYVNVMIQNSNVGTVTNSDGQFSIKINKSLNAKELIFSYIGFYNQKFSIGNEDISDVKIYMSPSAYQLDEITILSGNAREIVETAINKIPKNYSQKDNLLTNFYREIVQKRKKYINISEAVSDIYKTSYKYGVEHDRVKIFKGRRLVSPKLSDTLSVKLQGGPVLPIYVDIAKNKDILLEDEELDNYNFSYGQSISIDDRAHYAINFSPKKIQNYPLYTGTLYIDKETFTITRAEYFLDKDEIGKATNNVLRKYPAGLRFKLQELSYTTSYKLIDGASYLYYTRNEIKFKCDWKRRLFATTYTVISESVITDRKDDNVSAIPSKESFKVNQSLSENVSNFYDENFWENYNIIEPTESLENAIRKLKKQ